MKRIRVIPKYIKILILVTVFAFSCINSINLSSASLSLKNKRTNKEKIGNCELYDNTFIISNNSCSREMRNFSEHVLNEIRSKINKIQLNSLSFFCSKSTETI